MPGEITETLTRVPSRLLERRPLEEGESADEEAPENQIHDPGCGRSTLKRGGSGVARMKRCGFLHGLSPLPMLQR